MNDSADQARLPLHRMRVYNPGKLSDVEIEIAFVARGDLLERIMGDLAGERTDSRAQHHLIIGQRGMGKTTLLLRIAAALRRGPMSDRFVPLTFAEEQYAVDRLSKFWINCLDSLADACEAEGNRNAASRIDQIVAERSPSGGSSGDGDSAAAREVLDLFLAQAAAVGRRPVLLVDNLQLVFDRIDQRQQHELRELLMRPGAPILVGSSPQLPASTQDYGAPFYDHFKTHYLRPLTVDEMRRVILSLAQAAKRPDIQQHVVAHPGRLQALYQLTGGNPRTTVLLFHLYAEECTPSVFADLEQLLDLVTPLYKSRFEELAPQMQVVFAALAARWDPISSRDLAKQTALGATTISSQLDRLRKLGMVEEVDLFGTARRGYQIAERFFNIWFLMRHSSRRQRRQVEFLTRFLETFYEPLERERMARTVAREHGLSADRATFALSLADSLHKPHLRGELERGVHLDLLSQQTADTRARLLDVFEISSIPAETLAFDQLRGKLRRLLGDELAMQMLGSPAFFANRQIMAAVDVISEEQLTALRAILAEEQKLDERFGHDAVQWVRERLASGQLSDTTCVADWERTFHAAPDNKNVFLLLFELLPRAAGTRLSVDAVQAAQRVMTTSVATAHDWLAWANALKKLGRYAESESAYRRAIELDAKDASPWNNLGNLLQTHLGRYDESESAYRRAIELDANLAHPWNGLGNLLKSHLGRYDESEAAYRRAIELDAKYPYPWNGLGNLLQDHLGRYAESESAYRRAIELDAKDASPWNNLGNLLKSHLGRYDESEAAYRRAIELDANLAHPWNGLGNLLCDCFGRYEEADAAFEQALKREPDDEIAKQNRVFLQRDFLGRIDYARELFEKIKPRDVMDTYELQRALFAAYDQNWGIAAQHINAALDSVPNGLPSSTVDDWVRATAVLLRLGFGDRLIALLRDLGADVRLRPWYEAVTAHRAGAREALQNVAAEVRSTAEWFFDQIALRFNALQKETQPR